MASDRERVTLIREIAYAFASVQLDDGVSLHQARAMDNYEPEGVQRDARLRDPEVSWSEVTDAKLRYFQDVHPFLCPKGFRFYIPAFCIWVIRHLDDADSQWSFNTVRSLCLPEESAPWFSSQLEQFKLLSVDQASCLCRFLRYLVSAKCNESHAREALHRYWARYCAADR
jgi:hypothetical protein